MQDKKNKTLRLALMGILCALTVIVTWLLPIPMPATEGYVNFGDAVIFLTAAALGGVPAMIVGAIGSMLADIIGGYAHWAAFTLVIKGLEGLVAGLVYASLGKVNRKAALFIAMLAAALWMVVGYYFAGAAMYGWAGSLASVPGNLIQGGVSVGVAFILSLIFGKIRPLQRYFGDLK